MYLQVGAAMASALLCIWWMENAMLCLKDHKPMNLVRPSTLTQYAARKSSDAGFRTTRAVTE